MKIAIIGATGNAGSALIIEGYQRKHEMTAIVRDAKKASEQFGPEIAVFEKDAFQLTKEDLSRFDIVVNAYSPGSGDASLHQTLADHLLSELKDTTKPLIVFILGSSSLKKPNGEVIAKELYGHENEQAWIPYGIKQYEVYEQLKGINNVNWLAFSPQPMFIPGPPLPEGFQLGKDDIMFSSKGEPTITTGNAAKAIFDEIEKETDEYRYRITAADK